MSRKNSSQISLNNRYTFVVFPVLPDGRILLTEQEQPGREPFIGACGGRIDEGEDALTAAKRELLEAKYDPAKRKKLEELFKL